MLRIIRLLNLQKDYEFSTNIRKTFLGAFVDMLLDVDTFLVLPEDSDAWLAGHDFKSLFL